MIQQGADNSDPKKYGLAWLANMLHGPRAQGPLGSGESGRNDGTAISDMKTMDGSVLITLAMMGGIEHEAADTLKSRGVYERFVEIMMRQYEEAFGAVPLNEPVDFAAPRAGIPRDRLPDYQESPDSLGVAGRVARQQTDR